VNEWKEVRLGEVVQINPESLTKDYPFNVIDYIDISSVGTGELRETTQYPISEAPSRAKRLVRAGDTILSTVRPNRRSFLYLKKPKENQVVSTGFAVLRATEKINSRYLYYLISDQKFTDYLVSQEQGAAYPAVSIDSIKNAIVLLPDLETQEKIASILGSIDDKIELNVEMNKTLEEMAMTLYKHWFVDFGPFQDGEFVESELGMIPKGWRVISCYDLANYINGKAFKTNQLVDNDGLPVIKIAELKSGITNSTKFYNGDIEPKYLLQNGDILFAWSASLGVFIWAKGKAVLNQHIFNVKPNGTLSKSMIYFTLKNIIQEFIEIAASRATTMGHITKEHLIDKKIALPPDELLVKVDEKMSNYYQMILSNMLEVERLTQIRDYLLPRLLSGEIDVSKAEKQVEEVL
jgi:type I restriction enzyme S subunit